MPPLAIRRPPAPEKLTSTRIHAPIGGVNTVAPAGQLPPSDCLDATNLIGAEYGLRSRLGYEEWVTGISGLTNAIIPFVGSQKSGSTDKLFAASPQGIWDCTNSTATPSQLITYGITTGDAGWGTSCIVATPAGRFLVHCDEENGMYVYPEAGPWAKAAPGATVPWAPTTAYLVGDKVVNGPNTYNATVGGTSAGSGGPTGTGTGITDGTVTWNFRSAFSATAIGTSLADQHNGFNADPANFAAVCTWKNRVWLVERNTSRAWYSGINAIYGTYTSFDFGPKMQHGGPLAQLFNWAYDGGSGIDARLVGISTAGDIVIYGGTDPSSASTFGLVGSWYGGGVPYGRHLGTDYGGDLLVLTTTGVIPLSKLVIGNPIIDHTVYTTYKISNVINFAMDEFKTLNGWALQLHPTDNALLLTVPQAINQPTTQWAYSFASKGWFPYKDLPINSMGVWNGQLYFGTVDGRVCINTGYVDNVLRTNPDSFLPVQWRLLTGFENAGNARNKKVQFCRPTLLSQSPSPIVQTKVKYGYDLSPSGYPSGSVGTQDVGTWDVAVWDVDEWGGDYSAAQPLTGIIGLGRDVAIEVEGLANSRTVLEGIDVLFEQGGFL
jgi:hypothetical protein